MVVKFIKENPLEFIVIDINFDSFVLDPKQKIELIDFLVQTFEHHAITSDDTSTWFQLEKVKLEEVVRAKNKQIMITLDPRLFEIGCADLGEFKSVKAKYSIAELERKGLFCRLDYLESKWHNEDDNEPLFSSNLLFAKEVLNKPKYKVNQIVFTPKPHKIIKYALGIKPLRLDQKQWWIIKNEEIQYHLLELARVGDFLNFVMFDFLHFEPALLTFLLGLNYYGNLNIISVWAGTSDGMTPAIEITKILRNMIVRNNTLWIIDVQKDLHILQVYNSIHIVYSFSDDIPKIENFIIGPKSRILLNNIGIERESALNFLENTDEDNLEYPELKAYF